MKRAVRLKDYRKELTPVTNADKDCMAASKKMEGILSKIKRKYSVLVDAVNYLKPVPVVEEVRAVCTDGRKLFFNPGYILQVRDEETVVYQILHIIFHGLLGHFDNKNGYENRQLSWDVYDLQVSKLFDDAGIEVKDESRNDIVFMIETLVDTDVIFKDSPGFSLYYGACKDPSLQKSIRKNIKKIKCTKPFLLDDHTTWALPLLELNGIPQNSQGSNGSDENEGEKSQSGWISITLDITGAGGRVQNGNIPREIFNALSRAIKRSGQRFWGSSAGGYQGDEYSSEEKGIRNYSFLLEDAKKLSEVCGEEDEIDPALYEYGLMLYGDVPIIEPLEVKEIRKLGSVVIAVDTSGSCLGFLKEFWNETVEIFRELSETTEIEKLHFIECDSVISYEKEYDSVKDLETGESNSHRFTGYGGTDFRPVFKKAAEYESDGEHIDFLVYFSDGMGEYPTPDPGYPVYFVFPDEDTSGYSDDYRPQWIKKLVLDEIPAEIKPYAY